MKKENHKRNLWLSTKAQMALVFVILILLVALGVSLFLQFYQRYNENVLYEERLNQMQEVTGQLFSGLEDVVDVQWAKAKYQRNLLMDTMPKTVDEMVVLMSKQAVLNELSVGNEIIAMDTQGRYYTQNGKQGLIADMSYLDGRPEQVSYVFNGMTTTQTQMLFLCRLDEPLVLQDGKQTATIIYCGLALDMNELNPYFDCKAYGGNNSTYVVNNKGLMLFNGSSSSSSSSSKDLLEGFNIFAVLRKMAHLHGTSFDETMETLKTTGMAYSNALLDEQEYYYALYQMSNSEWILVFLVPSNYVAINTVQLVNTTTKLLLIFAVIMALVCAMLIYWVLRIQQKHALQTAEETNRVLEANNRKLEQAQATTVEALQAAEAASKAKTDFLSNMSHDIRTPMNAIIGLTTLMENEPGISDKMHDYIAKLESSGHHLLELINNVLDMNRIESGKTTLNVTNINLAEQVSQVESIIGAQADQRNQTFTILTSHLNHEYLIADPARLQQILTNILSNAVKYTPKGGHILFEIEEMPRNEHYAKYKFIVQDDGIGMNEEFIQHIFDPFVRAENSTTNKVQGSGLGMAITKSIVDLMGGVIHVESTPGKGSRFEVTLELPIDTEADKNVQHLSVLLVCAKDEDSFQRVKDAVAGKPVHLHRTLTWAETSLALRQASFDVVLMSLNTTETEVEQLRKMAGSSAILLGAAENQRTMPVAASGLDGVLPYPFFLSNLENEVQRVQQTRKEAIQQEDVSPLCGMRFLCAEDNEINAEILQMLLETKGASCTICRNGQEIVNTFAAVKPGEYDMILMDVQMPIMDGLEATRRIRNGENPLGKTIPILAMTANAFLEDMQKSKEAGMDEHLSKPVDIKVLEQTVRRFRLTPPEGINDGGSRFAR